MIVVFKNRQAITRILGIIGTVMCLIVFAWRPSFPTPDKLLVFLIFLFMAFNQALQMLKRVAPFIIVLLIYESFRSVANKVNTHVNYLFAPHFDKAVFGQLPTVTLQRWLWQGHTVWYDYVFYLAYMAHFILPLGLVILVWKTREKDYWRVVTAYLTVAFAAFVTFFIFPASPPWMASQLHYIAHIERISSDVWAGLGLQNFPSFYNHISPNPVAAIPSLHSAWATLFIIFIYKLYGKKWSLLAAVYPFLIFVGTIYEGEHYAFDVIAGIVYGVLGYIAAPHIIKFYNDRLAPVIRRQLKLIK